MMSNVPLKQPEPSINVMLGEWHQLLLSDETSSILPDDVTFRTDAEYRTFPWKLHALLETAAKEGFDHIVSWLDNNASFKVHEPALFIKHVMPRFFKRQSKYKSFQRQLNIWQFERVIDPKGPCNGGYFHVLFRRHDTSSFHQMKRSRLSQKSFVLERTSSHSSLDYEYDHIQTLQYPSDSLTTMVERELESRALCPSSAFLRRPNVNTDIRTSCGACSSVPNFEDVKVSIHSDPVKFDTCKPQYPCLVSRVIMPWTSLSGLITNSREQGEEENESPDDSFPSYWDNQQVPTSLETMPGIYVTSHLETVLDDDYVLSRSKSEEVNLEGSSSVVSVDEWKYVLVGMHIAMNAE